MINFQRIIEESISYELEAYNTYTLFSETFIGDSEFWQVLAEEELNHASVLKKGLSFYQGNVRIKDNFSIHDIESVSNCRKKIHDLVVQFKKEPTRELSFEIAIKIEEAAVEQNYQKFMNKVTDDSVLQIFQTLNGDEKDHLERIQKYSKSK